MMHGRAINTMDAPKVDGTILLMPLQCWTYSPPYPTVDGAYSGRP